MFIKGFGVGTVPLAAITKYPSAMEIYGLQMWYTFFHCATSVLSCWSFFRIEKDGCTQGEKVASL